MSTATLPRTSQQFLNTGFGFAPYAAYKKDSGVFVVERQPVFRSGTFRDSIGEQATYEPLHMKQMVENFNYLRNSNLFADVPARDGHPGWIMHNTPGTGAVVGWHTAVSVETMKSPVDGEEHDYFLADYEITEPYAVEKIQRGTWRGRSAEIIAYRTNNEAEYWPVYGGFAFVDIPAVEGLNFSRDTGGIQPGDVGRVRYFVMSDRENTVTSPAPGTPAPSQPAQPSAPAPSQPAQPTVPAPTPTPTPTAPQPASPPSQHSGGTMPHLFTVYGQATTDYSAVQRHITALETAITEARNQSRAAFVNQLATSQRIVGSEANITMLTNFAQSLSDEQFTAWQTSFGDMPQPAALGQHGVSVAGQAAPTNGAANQATDQIEIDKETVRLHRTLNRPADQLKATPSYQRLVAAGIEQA